MASEKEPPPEFGAAGELVINVVVGAVLFGALGAGKAALTDDGMAEDVIGGVISGVLIGLVWFWTSRKAKKFRATFDPAEQTLTRSSSGAAAAIAPDRSPRHRYRNRYMVILSVVLLAVYLGIAAVVSRIVEPPAGPGALAVIWGVSLLPGWMLALAWFTYLDVGPAGLRVGRLLRRDTIAWSELREVRWLRKDDYDVLLLVRTDGREIKSNAVVVSNMGWGKKRGALVLADIERTWAAAR